MELHDRHRTAIPWRSCLRRQRVSRWTRSPHAAEEGTVRRPRVPRSVLLKGPSFASWLYEGGPARLYTDVDFLVSPDDWAPARALMIELGYETEFTHFEHPREGSVTSEGWMRDDDHVDLHCTLWGLDADPAVVWDTLLRGQPSRWRSGARWSKSAVRPTAAHDARRIACRSARRLGDEDQDAISSARSRCCRPTCGGRALSSPSASERWRSSPRDCARSGGHRGRGTPRARAADLCRRQAARRADAAGLRLRASRADAGRDGQAQGAALRAVSDRLVLAVVAPDCEPGSWGSPRRTCGGGGGWRATASPASSPGARRGARRRDRSAAQELAVATRS